MTKNKTLEKKSLKEMRKELLKLSLEKHAGKVKNLRAIFNLRHEIAREKTKISMEKINKISIKN